MANRVSSNGAVGRIQADLARNAGVLADIQHQMATGKKLSKPSDGAGQVANALTERSNLRRSEQHAANATDALGWLRLSDDTLMSVQESLGYLKDRLVLAGNGAVGADSRAAIAIEIEGMRDTLLQLANTTYQGRAIFAGTAATGTDPFARSGEFTGNGEAVNRTIADGQALQVNATGEEIFGVYNGGDPDADPLEGNLFQQLSAIAAAVRGGDPAQIAHAIGVAEKASERVGVAQMRIGSRSNQVETTLDRNALLQMDVAERLSSIEDIDLAESIIRLRSQEVAYQAALGVTARVIQPSLMDFLR